MISNILILLLKYNVKIINIIILKVYVPLLPMDLEEIKLGLQIS